MDASTVVTLLGGLENAGFTLNGDGRGILTIVNDHFFKGLGRVIGSLFFIFSWIVTVLKAFMEANGKILTGNYVPAT